VLPDKGGGGGVAFWLIARVDRESGGGGVLQQGEFAVAARGCEWASRGALEGLKLAHTFGGV
jgi:hypothetical protein